MASDSLAGNRTLGGRDPVVVHFTRHKPFGGPQPGWPGHQFLCSLQELKERAAAAGAGGGSNGTPSQQP